MFSVYVLYSSDHKISYTGFTNNLIQRFYSHNLLGKTNWTCRYRPWVVLHIEWFDSKSDAMKREKELKSGKGRDWINNNLAEWIKVFS